MKPLRAVLSAAFILVSGVTSNAFAQHEIVEFKDDVFANTRILQQEGDFTRFDYNELRDINGRDVIPGKKAHAKYVATLESRLERRRNVDGVETYEAGNPETATFAVIFIHGGGGDGSLGFSDVSFGGNFSRLKNLVVRSGGVYESPSMRGFEDISQVEKLAREIKSSAKIVLACGSMGGQICWRAYTSKNLAKRLAGVVLLGGYPHSFSKNQAGVQNRVPVYLAHGSRDPVYDWRIIGEEFKWLKSSKIPSKFALYESGNHGTPIRMINWRETLNWILNSN